MPDMEQCLGGHGLISRLLTSFDSVGLAVLCQHRDRLRGLGECAQVVSRRAGLTPEGSEQQVLVL